MAGSRVPKIGTIFSRVTGLLRSGALKDEDKPIWYDVYKAFPPKYEPRFDRPPPPKDHVIPNLFYEEDVVRAKFYKTFGSPGLVDMSTEKTTSLAQKFLNKYDELKKQAVDVDEEKLFQETAEQLLAQGVLFSNDPKWMKQQPTPLSSSSSSAIETEDATEMDRPKIQIPSMSDIMTDDKKN